MKRTIYVGNPAYLSRKDAQLVIDLEDSPNTHKIPLEDIGVLILDHYHITVSQAVLQTLMAEGSVVMICDEKHHPNGLLLPYVAHHEYAEKLRLQMEASLPLQKQLWKHTVQCKIKNQASLLTHFGIDTSPMRTWVSNVKSGDIQNHESRAAVWYWKKYFDILETECKREQESDVYPNAHLNYGYAVLRAIVARSLLASGLHPALGIHHKNSYNPYALADDIMEPYRPFVDYLVWECGQRRIEEQNFSLEILKEDKQILLKIPALKIEMNEEEMPLSYALTRTCSSLAKCYAGTSKTIIYPYGIPL